MNWIPAPGNTNRSDEGEFCREHQSPNREPDPGNTHRIARIVLRSVLRVFESRRRTTCRARSLDVNHHMLYIVT
jgi:hypothetical protein